MGDTGIIYQALFLKSGGSITPRLADDLELWEVALLLKATYAEPTSEDGKPTVAPDTDRFRLIRQRIAESRGEGPPPEVRPVNPKELDQLQL